MFNIKRRSCPYCGHKVEKRKYLGLYFFKTICSKCGNKIKVNLIKRLFIALVLGIMVVFIRPLFVMIDFFEGANYIFLFFYIGIMLYVITSDSFVKEKD
ncbi:MAG: hypothetical protein H6584_06415 [Flavobacteriales bacterium]|nr:hypothetical protein [Flavobacteriales bacterium]